MYKVFVVSDGTGRTAEQALSAALTQFANVEVEIERRSEVRSERDVRRIVDEASNAGGFIIHTLVTDSLRDLMFRASRKRNVATIDLMGPLLVRLSDHFSVHPAEKPGLFEQLNKYYFRRIETMEFAIRHDDGVRAHELTQADIVLLGVSRTFKTPLSVYLAFRGWYVANIPIVLNVPVPPVVHSLPPGNVICLDTVAAQLASLRRTRDEYLGGQLGQYADLDFVHQELRYARSIFNSQPSWPIIDVTNKPIEEIAAQILALKGVESNE